MKISKKEIEHLAELSRLELTPEEKEKFSKELTRIVDYIDQLRKLETTKIRPYSATKPAKMIGREDRPEIFSDAQKILEAAPKRRFDKIEVKAVFK